MLCTCVYKTLSFYCDVKEGGEGGVWTLRHYDVKRNKISLEMLPKNPARK